MADIRCPQCGKPNPKELEECQFCGTRIKPLLASTPVDSKPIQAGEQPIPRDTSEFEKVKPLDEGPIHAGDAPVRRDTGELERALPTWLQSLRKGEDPAEESASEPSPGLGLPTPAGAGQASDGATDWLSGLGKAASEDEEEVPDWLAGLRGGQPVSTPADSIPEANISAEDSDWMKALGSELRSGLNAPEANAPVASSDEVPDWMQGLQGGTSIPEERAAEPASPAPSDGNLPDWLSGLSGESAAAPAVEPPIADSGSLPDWLGSLDHQSAAPEPAASTPEWLAGLPGISAESEPPAETLPEQETVSSGLESNGQLPDWLNQLKQKASEPETASGSTPNWEASFGPEPGTPISAPGESVPEWLSNLEQKPGTGALSNVFEGGGAEIPAPSGETPDWLSQLQADVTAAQAAEDRQEEFEAAPPEKKEADALPDWLAGMQASTGAASAAPALIVGNESAAAEQEGAAFSMETPDWLSKLKPEERSEKKAAAEDETASESLQAADLPSWVQAMRPVEAVVSAEPQATPIEESVGGQVEQSGPLAGLQGVLPAAPGLGPLRKPPAYSIKLQVTENQRKYAAYLERMVTLEAQAKAPGAGRLASSRLWRWTIFGLLFAVVLLALVFGLPSTQAAESPELRQAYETISRLSSSAQVLVVFDYDPALFGEMEAAASPLMNHLLSRNPTLAFVSTSPTGPALAERFMQATQTSAPYVDLGYLPGGPSGVLGFATNPLHTIEATGDDLLQNVTQLSDFSLIVILTDNADTGRVWIEQTRSMIDPGTPGNFSDDTPILMAISAQAEPMLVPYYDSGQVQGIVTGLLGGKAYEQKNANPNPGPADKYWNAFSAAIFAVELLITGGALWGAFTGWQARKKKTGGDA